MTNVEVENTHITLPEVTNHRFPVRIYRPKNYEGPKLPVMLYFHGGYWCSGSADSEDLGCRAIVSRGVRLVIVSFEYRLAPETPWASIFADAEYAMKWLAGHAGDVGGDAARGFLVGGATSGAHLAALCAVRARDRYPNIRLTGQLLIVPTLMAWRDADDADRLPAAWRGRLASHAQMAAAPVLGGALYELYVDALGVPDDERRRGDNFPMWASSHRGLPPAYLPMDECDPTRDQGFLYAELLQEAGVLTRTDYYEGLPNMFVQFAELETTLLAGIHLAAAMRWLLQERK